jgi:hypothetical protein
VAGPPLFLDRLGMVSRMCIGGKSRNWESRKRKFTEAKAEKLKN